MCVSTRGRKLFPSVGKGRANRSDSASDVMTRYLLSCGLLTVPILVWNVVFTPYLPPSLASAPFNRDIPTSLLLTENMLRVVVMVLPFLMPLDVASAAQRRGLAPAYTPLSRS